MQVECIMMVTRGQFGAPITALVKISINIEQSNSCGLQVYYYGKIICLK